jgi:hypothetical protein
MDLREPDDGYVQAFAEQFVASLPAGQLKAACERALLEPGGAVKVAELARQFGVSSRRKP